MDDAHRSNERNGADSAHGLAALLPKLQHPLVNIRARALASLVFKLRERLVDVRALDRAAAHTLTSSVVACCAEHELEVAALHALELLLDVRPP